MLLALVLVGIWWLLSGRFDLLHFGAGVLTALVIAATFAPVEDHTSLRVRRLLAYVPWLMLQIVISNLRVARNVLSPRLRISPSFVAQPPGVAGPRGLTLLGSSITLTPGTLTVDIGEDEVLVHALDAASARDIRANLVASRVAGVFEEPAGP